MSAYQQNYIRIKIIATGQVIDMAPMPATAMIRGGSAVRVDEPEETKKESVLTAARDVVVETATRAAAVARRVVNRSAQA